MKLFCIVCLQFDTLLVILNTNNEIILNIERAPQKCSQEKNYESGLR